MTDSHPAATPGRAIRVADLAKGQTRAFRLEPGAEERAAIAGALDLVELRKLRFEGKLAPLGKRDWRLTARLGGTVVQTCVVSLEPVTTRIEEDVARNFVTDWVEPEADELELPESVDDEPLGDEIDLGRVMVEALALALPPYPRAPEASLEAAQFTEPGKVAMRDEDARPFAGLAALREHLAGKDEG